MTLDNNTKLESAKDESKDSPDLSQWNAFAWKLVRSLAIIVAGTTAIFFICRWLIY